MKGPPADALVLFGVTGDLAQRKLFPALYELTAEGRADVPIIGVARSDWDADAMRRHVRESLSNYPSDVVEKLAARFSYVRGDYNSPDTFSTLR